MRYYFGMQNLKTATACTALLLAILSATAVAQHHQRHSSSSGDNTSPNFDYYLLALSWAPEFCATHKQNASSSECDPKRHLGLVVHGMWPQNNDGEGPQHCGSAKPVPDDVVRRMLPIIPARGLIQHEWETHGTCSGLGAQDYFAAIEKVFRGLNVPPEYQKVAAEEKLDPQDIKQKFAAANNAPVDAFRVNCAGGDFVELRACLTKDLQYRDCGSMKDCRAPQITVRPTP